MRLMLYRFTISYVLGKFLTTTNAPMDVEDELMEEVKAHVNYIMYGISVSKKR